MRTMTGGGQLSRTRGRGVSVAAAFVIGIAIAALFRPAASATQGERGHLVLLDQRDAARLKLTDHEWRHVPRTRGIQAGPRIIVKRPPISQSSGVPTIETTSPVTLSVVFDDDRSPVDMSTLEVSAHRGPFSKSLTAMLRPFIRQNALEVSNARIPLGRFLLEVSIADQAGNRTDEMYRLEVMHSVAALQASLARPRIGHRYSPPVSGITIDRLPLTIEQLTLTCLADSAPSPWSGRGVRICASAPRQWPKAGLIPKISASVRRRWRGAYGERRDNPRQA